MKKRVTNYRNCSLLILFLFLIILFSSFSSAVVVKGNITLVDIGVDPAAYFNFTNQSRADIGHFRVRINDSNGNTIIEGRDSVLGMWIGYLGPNPTEFMNDFLKAPPQNHTTFGGSAYRINPIIMVRQYEGVAFAIPNGTGGYNYAVVYVNSSLSGKNASFYFKYNSIAEDNTFGSVSGCGLHETFNSCIEDQANRCFWGDLSGFCRQGDFFKHDVPPAECTNLPKSACDRINGTVCSWDSSLGTNGKCVPGVDFNPLKGYNCSQIINVTFCINQSFTEKTGLCSWNSSSSKCYINSSKTFADIPKPPVFFCEAPGYVNNQANCEELANKYYMPCGWKNTTGKCGDIFFDFGIYKNFDDIGSESSCQSAGGNWRSETAFDPITAQVSTESWCEFGVAVKTFGQVGGGGSSFTGPSGKLNDCSVDCFACEFNTTGGRWQNTSVAQTQCEASARGCRFRSDTNSFNGYGWCEPASGAGGFGGFNCENNCGDCNMQPSPQSACQNSPAGCKWENITNICLGNSVQGCNQQCKECFDDTSCGKSAASGGCSWDSSGNFCKPKSGSYEICYNGVDDDTNGKTDCADFKCSFDTFCAGSATVGGNCFKFDMFSYQGNLQYAQSNCSATTGCKWISENQFFGRCAPLSEQCFENDTLSASQSTCESYNDGKTCKFKANPGCFENSTTVTNCTALPSQVACAANSMCGWIEEGFGQGHCENKAFVSCDLNQSLQYDQAACKARGCAWRGDQFGGGFDGGFGNRCVNPCSNSSITSASLCSAAGLSSFGPFQCQWQLGFCEPKNFVGGCFENDADYSTCVQNANCNWREDFFGPLKDLNGSTDFSKALHPGAGWLAVGLNRPDTKAVGAISLKNESNYTLRMAGGNYLTLVMTTENISATSSQVPNISRLYCNEEILLQYNFSSNTCMKGTCNKYNNSVTCNNYRVNYYLNNGSKQLEVLWEVPIYLLTLDQTEGNINVTDVSNKTTVTIDGNLTEQIPENASALDGSNATRVRISAGFCQDGLTNNFFKGMEDNAPEIISADGPGDADTVHLDIMGIGVKKTPEAYMYGITLVNISHSALCNGVPLQTGGVGSATNKSKYYLYMDTDGKQTGGCTPENNLALAGFEYLFKYIVEIDGTTQKLTETFLSTACSNGSWAPTNIALKSDKYKSCSLIGGPIFGIDKDTLTGKSDVNTSVGWRVYATTAGETGNTSAVNDTSGPGTSDFKGIDVELIDCSSTKDKDDDQCTKFKQFGFFPGEFGPACKDNIDNDGDSSTDCSDTDCKYDPFFCGGSFTIDANDKSAPSLVWTKANEKIPTTLSLIFDTNEPSNGSVRFYNNDSKCSTINNTIKDKTLGSISLTDYRPHHVAEVTGLAPNRTYYYKFEVCDPSGNCAVSKCSNATTSLSHSNITFKLEIPVNWSVDIPSMNLSNYSLSYALKASTEHLDNINLTIHSFDNKTAITFAGIDIFEKQTLNVSQFITGSSFIGVDANQYQSFKQKTGMDKAVVKIPTNGDIVQHCDEDGTNCQTVTSSLSCSFASTYTLCEIPDAVGLGFSTYKASTTTSSPSPSPSGGSSGSGSSGGGTPLASTVAASAAKSWQTIASQSTQSMKISSSEIGIAEIVFTAAKQLSSVELTVSSLKANPESIQATPNVYKYLTITAKNVASGDITNTQVTFKVPLSWLTALGIASDSVALYRHTQSGWNELPTNIQTRDSVSVTYVAATPGFSSFAIAAKSVEKEVPIPTTTTAAVVQEEVQPPLSTSVTAAVTSQPIVEEQGGSSGYGIIIIGVIAIVLALAIVVLAKKKK